MVRVGVRRRLRPSESRKKKLCPRSCKPPRACYNIGMKENTEDRDINIAIAGIFAGSFIAVGILHMLISLIGSLGVGPVLGIAILVGWAAVTAGIVSLQGKRNLK